MYPLWRSIPILLLSLSSFAQPAAVNDSPAQADSTVSAAESTGEQPKEKPPVVHETMVVTATRSERAVSELPMSTTVLREEEIRATPAVAIDDLLRTIPGLHVPLTSAVASSPNSQRISMHGLGGTRALVMVDGVPMHDPYFGTVQWQKVPIDSLRQVEVVRGANASLFGNQALGGTINLITRPVDASEVRVDLSAGNVSSNRGVFTVDQVFTDALAVRLSHNRSHTDGHLEVPVPGNVDVPVFNGITATSARIDFRPDERTTSFFKANVAKVGMGQGTVITYLNRRILDFAGGVHRNIRTNGLLSVTAFHQTERVRSASSSVTSDRNSETLSTRNEISPAEASGASVEWSLQRSGWIPTISIGADVQQLGMEEERTAFARSGAVTSISILGGDQKFAGVFGQASFQPSNRLEILASARVDYFRNERGREAVVGGATTQYPSNSATEFDPRVSIRYELAPRAVLRGAAYRAFKVPTPRELYRSSVTNQTTILANPFLQPEKLVGAEIGMEWTASRSRFELNLYRSEIDGLQVRVPFGSAPNVLINTNVGSGRSQGIEAMADVQLGERWTLRGGYTYADSVITENPIEPTLIGKQVPDVPKHSGSLDVRFRALTGTIVTLRGRSVGRSFGEPTNAVPAPAHQILDVSIAHPVRPWMDVYGRLENAFDESYYLVLTPTSFRMAQPRNFAIGVRMRIPTGSRG